MLEGREVARTGCGHVRLVLMGIVGLWMRQRGWDLIQGKKISDAIRILYNLRLYHPMRQVRWIVTRKLESD
jgi:hypothetical protein